MLPLNIIRHRVQRGGTFVYYFRDYTIAWVSFIMSGELDKQLIPIYSMVTEEKRNILINKR
jgi:hypothetical protein